MAIRLQAIHSWSQAGPRGRLLRYHLQAVSNTPQHHRSANNRGELMRYGVSFPCSSHRAHDDTLRLCLSRCSDALALTDPTGNLPPPLYTLHVRQNTCKPMLGETLNPPAPTICPPPVARTLPRHLLYSIFARIGGSGLDTDAFETLRASYHGGFLGKAIAYDNRQNEIPASKIQSLRWHPVRLLSSLDRPYYYGAKKKYLDWIASRQLATGRYDLFHSWSGDCLESLRVTQRMGIPSIVEIPTSHRDFSERAAPRTEPRPSKQRTPLGRWKNELVLRSERSIEEYDLATLLLVLAEKAADTFRESGIAKEKLFYLPRGVEVERFKPGTRPSLFRAIFSGALIERKGIHHLLEAWHRLNLKNAELWLLGSVHEQAKSHLKEFWRANIRLIGFARDVEKYLNQATIHVFPSQLEGSAKVTYEAAACGLPQ